MPGVFGAMRRRSWSISSTRFLRDVTASVLAAGVAAVGFSHLSHEPMPPAAHVEAGKHLDRLTWEVEEVPTRLTLTYDSIAMFALPQVEPGAWSEVQPEAPKPNATLCAAGIERSEREPRRVAALPPSRPAAPAVAAAPAVDEQVPAGAQRVQDGLYVLGWHVPGTEHIPAVLPDGRNVMKTAANIGGKVTGIGQTLAETVGLK